MTASKTNETPKQKKQSKQLLTGYREVAHDTEVLLAWQSSEMSEHLQAGINNDS